jgi:hypothetical protein
VPLHSERKIVRIHARTVIDDADQASTASLDRDLDAACAGIDCVLDEFLDSRSGSLDDLARCDTVDEDRIEATDGARWRGHAEETIGALGPSRKVMRETLVRVTPVVAFTLASIVGNKFGGMKTLRFRFEGRVRA